MLIIKKKHRLPGGGVLERHATRKTAITVGDNALNTVLRKHIVILTKQVTELLTVQRRYLKSHVIVPLNTQAPILGERN
jgi:hypothetical protein